MNRKSNQTCGFTLVEMLTTIAIIAVMIGLLIPALSMVQKTAGNVRQKGQFYAIGTALEAFRGDMGDYPEAEWKGMGAKYSAAQKLAEAVVGYDGFGFHPLSKFTFDGKADVDGDTNPELVYDVANGITGTNGFTQSAADNLAARKGPYLEIENARAVKLSDIYANTGNLEPTTYVLADSFGKVKHRSTGKPTGMPILYFRANTTKVLHDPAAYWNSTYNINDNYCNGDGLLLKAPPFDVSLSHPLADNANFNIFYDRTANPNFTSPRRPYRANSFILLSAGIDGLYGTPDDVYNFSDGEQ